MPLLLHYVCSHVFGHTWPSRPGIPPVQQAGALHTNKRSLTERLLLGMIYSMDHEHSEVGLVPCHVGVVPPEGYITCPLICIGPEEDGLNF